MNWLNLETRMLRSPEFIGSEPQERATWLCLMAYCAEQENGGVIEDCAEWKDRRWQQTCGVTRDEALAACELWGWDGDSIHLWGYPKDKESEVQRLRESGARGGKKRGANVVKEAASSTMRNSASSTMRNSASSTMPNGASSTTPNGASSTTPNGASSTTPNGASSTTPNGASSTTPNGASTEEKGIEEKRKEGNSLSDEASESADFSEDVPTVAIGGMEVLAKRICGLRQEWSRIALSYSERQGIDQNAASLHSVSEDDWRTIRDYLRATIPEGRPAWQPRSRAKFVETIGDVLNYALEWQRRRTPSSNMVQVTTPIKVVSAEERKETMEEFASVFGKARS